MNTSRLTLSILAAIVMASVAAPLLIQRHARIQRREREALLREQAGQFEELSAENKRLLNLVAQMGSSSLSSDRFRELMKLRSEISRLRQDATEEVKLQAARQQLLAASRKSASESEPALPDPQFVLAYWPKAQLSSSGYGDPISGLHTMLWAMLQNDPSALTSSMTPEANSDVTNGALGTALWALSRSDPDALAGNSAPETKYAKWLENLSADERMAFQARVVADMLGPSSGFHVVGQKLTSQDQTVLDVYFEGESKTRAFALRKIGDEWKVDGIYPTGLNGNDPRKGPKLWP